jgi:hypothetical protein
MTSNAPRPPISPRRGILLDNPAFGGTVYHRKRRRQKLRGSFNILGRQCATHRANLVPEARFAFAIDFGAPFHLTHSLECGICIRHLR